MPLAFSSQILSRKSTRVSHLQPCVSRHFPKHVLIIFNPTTVFRQTTKRLQRCRSRTNTTFFKAVLDSGASDHFPPPVVSPTNINPSLMVPLCVLQMMKPSKLLQLMSSPSQNSPAQPVPATSLTPSVFPLFPLESYVITVCVSCLMQLLYGSTIFAPTKLSSRDIVIPTPSCTSFSMHLQGCPLHQF